MIFSGRGLFKQGAWRYSASPSWLSAVLFGGACGPALQNLPGESGPREDATPAAARYVAFAGQCPQGGALGFPGKVGVN